MEKFYEFRTKEAKNLLKAYVTEINNKYKERFRHYGNKRINHSSDFQVSIDL